MQPECPFCNLTAATISQSNDHAAAFRDGFPISKGHTLVIPTRHVQSLFELAEAEQQAVWSLVAKVRVMLIKEFKPDGINIGLNDGLAAGQTILHAHVHVIPRFKDDVPDPRGGIRWIIPTKAKYWK
jgi:diadenosine tetraphosphate (Ap4A) HIT family hydrolase